MAELSALVLAKTVCRTAVGRVGGYAAALRRPEPGARSTHTVGCPAATSRVPRVVSSVTRTCAVSTVAPWTVGRNGVAELDIPLHVHGGEVSAAAWPRCWTTRPPLSAAAARTASGRRSSRSPAACHVVRRLRRVTIQSPSPQCCHRAAPHRFAGRRRGDAVGAGRFARWNAGLVNVRQCNGSRRKQADSLYCSRSFREGTPHLGVAVAPSDTALITSMERVIVANAMPRVDRRRIPHGGDAGDERNRARRAAWLTLRPLGHWTTTRR